MLIVLEFFVLRLILSGFSQLGLSWFGEEHEEWIEMRKVKRKKEKKKKKKNWRTKKEERQKERKGEKN